MEGGGKAEEGAGGGGGASPHAEPDRNASTDVRVADDAGADAGAGAGHGAGAGGGDGGTGGEGGGDTGAPGGVDAGDGAGSVGSQHSATAYSDASGYDSAKEAEEVEPSEREAIVFRAKLCEKLERVEEQFEHGCALVDAADTELSEVERGVVQVAFKNMVAKKRAAWRALTAPGPDADARVAYRNECVKPELEALLQRVLAYAGKIKERTQSDEGHVFVLTMIADYNRYLGELEERQLDPLVHEIAMAAVESYKEASVIAKRTLAPTDPLRLGLALNYAVFYFDVCNNPERAIQFAKLAFDAAIEGLDDLATEEYRDSALLMQLLRDNITLWAKAMPDSDEDEAVKKLREQRPGAKGVRGGRRSSLQTAKGKRA